MISEMRRGCEQANGTPTPLERSIFVLLSSHSITVYTCNTIQYSNNTVQTTSLLELGRRVVTSYNQHEECIGV